MTYSVGDECLGKRVTDVHTWPDNAQDLTLEDGTAVSVRPNLDRVFVRQPTVPEVTDLQAALRALWPERPVVYFREGQGEPVLTPEEQAQLGRVAQAICDARQGTG